MALRFLTRRNNEILPTTDRRDVEMQATSAEPSSSTPTSAQPLATNAGPDTLAVPTTANDNQPQESSNDPTRTAANGHGREASGRSVISQISSRFAAIRERERSEDFALAVSRSQFARQLHDLEAGLNAEAAASAANGTNLTSANSKKETIKARKERDEASALLGPSLSHYFGSGSSSSGAVTGTVNSLPAAAPPASSQQATSPIAENPSGSPDPNATDSNNPTTPAALPETPGGFGSLARRARLGSRGRARGASLSGLSMSMTDAPLETPSRFNGPAPSSPGADTSGDPLNLEALTEAVAMAEGIDIEVLKQWIDRSLDDAGAVEIEGAAEEAAEKAMQAPSYCTTLESLVNLKRNTIHLMASSIDLGVRATSTALPPVGENVAEEEEGAEGAEGHPLSPSQSTAPPTSAAVVQESSLRPARSLSTMPSFGSAAGSNTGLRGSSSHQLHFEYDCSSPYASVQIFVRASRKHGSWQSWIQKREEQGKPINTDGAEESLWFKKGPPPHVLGWPVHSSQVRKGFAQPVKASLMLQIELYAPPSQRPSAMQSEANDAAGASQSPGDAPSKPMTTADVQGIEDENALSRVPTLAPIPSDETKEQRLAREKQERETLKLAVVVEALDENGQPFPEPNLQTTYLRLTSLPIRSPPNSNAAGNESLSNEMSGGQASSSTTNRLWTAHVEGQEAEIGSHRFQLQELYGLSSRPPPIQVDTSADGVAAAGGTTEDAGPVIDVDNMGNVGSECLICLSSPTNTLLLPCTHGLCLDCSIQLKESVKAQRDSERRRGKIPKKKYNCPMCRRAFTSMLHLKAVDPTTAGNAEGDTQEDLASRRSSSMVKEDMEDDDSSGQGDQRFVIGEDGNAAGSAPSTASPDAPQRSAAPL
ncbi:unnamed protein product [Sympodiomycopsis kandeliae]